MINHQQLLTAEKKWKCRNKKGWKVTQITKQISEYLWGIYDESTNENMGGTWDRHDTALSEEKSQHWIDETTTSYKLHLKTGNNCEEMLTFLSLGNCRSVIFTSYSNILLSSSKYPTIQISYYHSVIPSYDHPKILWVSYCSCYCIFHVIHLYPYII